MWLGTVKSMSRRPSHWPTKFSVKAAAFGSLSMRSTCRRKRVGLIEFALLGQGEQLLVGHRAPQEVRQPAGQGEVVELAGLLAEEQEIRRTITALEADADGLLERVLLGQLGLDQGEERLDVGVGHRPPKGAAGEVAEDALGVGRGSSGDDLHAVAVVVDRRRRLRQVAEEAAMALRRPGLVQRPFHLDPMDRQPRPVVLVGAHLVDDLRRRPARRGGSNGAPGLQVIDELDDGRLVGRGVEVADQVVLRPPSPSGRRRRDR